MVQRERRRGDTIQTETAYFISSLPPDAERLLTAVQSHWQIENNLHWVLDVIFHGTIPACGWATGREVLRCRGGWYSTSSSYTRPR
jgi:hypothetical protein